ncbi:uncharacterized protein LOC143040997 isoform X2 [Oratosquilla oratoria]|uniref:uncharacterized protein LOC143040997 isoform X2 n=1 Tax=Oratosquilla oratoria TaxID=337810 RepID=UPI003F76E769
MERGRGRGRGRAAGAGSQPPWSRMLLFLLAVIAVLSPSLLTSVSAAIDCFKCVSLNGDNPACEDPFHNNFSVGILESPCMAGRKQREGLFPATACIKLAGIYADDLTPMIIRDCAVDSGSITLDTELSRMSHCGAFVLSGRYVKGCLQSCDDSDGCNGAQRAHDSLTNSLLTTFSVLVTYCANVATARRRIFFFW